MNPKTEVNKDLDKSPDVQLLYKNIIAELPKLTELLEQCNSEWYGEDGLYRFYHQSFKAFRLQDTTERIVRALSDLMPNHPFNDWFEQIINEGTGKQFGLSANQRWLVETRPIVEAYFHAKAFLELMVKYGGLLEYPPNWMPTGWAMILYLYNLR